MFVHFFEGDEEVDAINQTEDSGQNWVHPNEVQLIENFTQNQVHASSQKEEAVEVQREEKVLDEGFFFFANKAGEGSWRKVKKKEFQRR